MRIAWISSTHIGSRSLFFTEQIAPLLSQKGYEIEFFNPSKNDPLTMFQHHKQRSFDLHFYQVEEGTHCHWIRTLLGTQPGVVLFHDALLTDYGSDPISNSSWTDTVRKYKDSERPWPSKDAEYKRSGYLATREMALSILPLFSTPRGCHDFKSANVTCIGGERSYYLPEPVTTNESILLPKPLSPLVIGLCGRPRIEDRIHKIVQGIYESGIPFKLLWLLKEKEKKEAEEYLKHFAPESYEIIVGKTPYSWLSLLPSIHIPIHMRFSVFESTAPYLQMSMAAGRTPMVSNFGDEQALPDQAVVKIDPGACEATAIKEYIRAVYKNPELLSNSVAQQYAMEVHNPQVIAQDLHTVFHREKEYIQHHMIRWDAFLRDAKKNVLDECMSYEVQWGQDRWKNISKSLGWYE